ncbi:hypothetical protein ACJJJB_00040 (plasmid) [Microbulbifer sp. ANSA001]|uniref:hypothetical protein n=1 Tax=Microbulbifer sp. ANSA001 TaxID=3243358 RepID=UPI004042D83B
MSNARTGQKKRAQGSESGIPKHKGIPVELGGKTYIVPSMSLGSVEKMIDRIQEFSGGLDPESIGIALDATHAAIVRNYPDFTREELTEEMDLGNMVEIMHAVMDVSGLRRKAAEQEAASEVAGEGAAPLTGEKSTLTSAPASAGPGSTAEKT